MIYHFSVGRLACAVISDGQMEPMWQPPLSAFLTSDSGVSGHDLHHALAAAGHNRTTVACGYNCLVVETTAGHAVIDTGLSAAERLLILAYHMRFPGLGVIERRGGSYAWSPVHVDESSFKH